MLNLYLWLWWLSLYHTYIITNIFLLDLLLHSLLSSFIYSLLFHYPSNIPPKYILYIHTYIFSILILCKYRTLPLIYHHLLIHIHHPFISYPLLNTNKPNPYINILWIKINIFIKSYSSLELNILSISKK